MKIIDIINNRHSYRGKYKPISVPREDLITIMQAGLNSPSGCNKQTTSLIAVDDKVFCSSGLFRSYRKYVACIGGTRVSKLLV